MAASRAPSDAKPSGRPTPVGNTVAILVGTQRKRSPSRLPHPAAAAPPAERRERLPRRRGRRRRLALVEEAAPGSARKSAPWRHTRWPTHTPTTRAPPRRRAPIARSRSVQRRRPLRRPQHGLHGGVTWSWATSPRSATRCRSAPASASRRESSRVVSRLITPDPLPEPSIDPQDRRPATVADRLRARPATGRTWTASCGGRRPWGSVGRGDVACAFLMRSARRR